MFVRACALVRPLQFLLCISQFVHNTKLSLGMLEAACFDNSRVRLAFVFSIRPLSACLCIQFTMCVLHHADNNNLMLTLDCLYWDLISRCHFYTLSDVEVSRYTDTQTQTQSHTFIPITQIVQESEWNLLTDRWTLKWVYQQSTLQQWGGGWRDQRDEELKVAIGVFSSLKFTREWA